MNNLSFFSAVERRCHFKHSLAALLFAVFFLGGAGPLFASHAVHKNNKHLLTPRELMGQLMAFADSYQEQFLEVIHGATAKRELDPRQKIFYSRLKTYYITSAITNASQMNPEIGLLDMVTMVTLQRMISETPEIASVAGDRNAKIITGTLRELEERIWGVAELALTRQQVRDLRKLIEEWRMLHPDERHVAFIRFDDFAKSRMKDAFNEIIQRGGLLGPVNEAVRELHESRMMAERGLFLLERMPMIMQWEEQLFALEMLYQPETIRLLTDITSGVGTLNEFKDVIEDLPKSAMKQQKEFFKEAHRLLEGERKLFFADLQKQNDALKLITKQASDAASELRLMFDSIERMADPEHPRPADQPSGLDKINSGLVKLQAATKDVNALVAALDVLMEKTGQTDLSPALQKIDSLAEKHERQIAMYAAGLIVLIFILGLFLIRYSRKTD